MKKIESHRNLFVFLFLAMLLCMSGTLPAQTQKILNNVKLDNLTLKEAMVKITSQSGYYFVYEDADIMSVPKISKEFRSSSIEADKWLNA